MVRWDIFSSCCYVRDLRTVMWEKLEKLEQRVAKRLGGMFDQGHKKVLSGCAWSQHHILTGSYDGTAKLWDVVTGLVIHTLVHDTEKAVTAVDLSETMCFTGGRNTIKVWSDAKGELLSTFPAAPEGGEVKTVSVSPKHGDPRVLALAVNLSDDGGSEIRICNVTAATGTLTARGVLRQPHGAANCWCVRWSIDEHWLLSSGADKTARVWEIERVPVAHDDAKVDVWFRCAAPTAVTGELHTEDVWCCVFAKTSDGLRAGGLFTGSGDGFAARWVVGATSPMTVYRGHVRSSPACVCGRRPIDVFRITDSHHHPSLRAPQTKHIRAMDIDETDQNLYTGSNDCTVRQFAVASGDCLRVFVHVPGVRGVATSPSGCSVVTAGMDGVGYIWEGGALDDEVSGQEYFSPHGTLQKISWFEISIHCLNQLVLTLQIASFAFLPSYNWNHLTAPVQRFLTPLSRLADYIPSASVNAEQAAAFCLILLTVVSFCFDWNGRLLDFVTKLNREGRGIQRHWHFGPQIDFETRIHKATQLGLQLIHLLHFVSAGVLFIPTIRLLAQTLVCLYSNSSDVDCSNFDEGLTFVSLALVPFYLAASVRVGVADGAISELSPLPKHVSRRNPCAIFFTRMRTWDHSHVPQMGEFTAQPASARILALIEITSKLGFTVLAVLAVNNAVSLSLVNAGNTIAVALVVLYFPTYLNHNLNHHMVSVKLFLVRSKLIHVLTTTCMTNLLHSVCRCGTWWSQSSRFIWPTSRMSSPH